MNEGTIWQHIPELWQIAVAFTVMAVPAIVYVVKLSARVKELHNDHKELKR